MAVRFVLGRAGSGKTHHCLSALTIALASSDAGPPLLLLVPEQATLQMEQALVRRSARGGFTRARVLSFSSLADLIYEETGRPSHILSSSARRFVLRMLLDRLDLDHTVFARLISSRGFLETVDAALLQFQRAALSAEDVRRIAEEQAADAPLAAKLTFLADLYQRYEAWLGDQRLDAPAEQKLLTRRVREIAWLSQARLWVDGFAGFTALESSLLVALCRAVGSAEITLLLNPGATLSDAAPAPAHSLFDPIAETRRELERRLRAAKVELLAPLHLTPATTPRFAESAHLREIESLLCGERTCPLPPPQPTAEREASLRVVRCNTLRDELRYAAREIRRRVAASGGATRFSDFAVMSRDLSTSAALVREVFDEYEIPIFLDQRRSLSAHMLTRAVAALFEAALGDLPPEPILTLLQSGLTRGSRDAAEKLELIIRRHSVRGRELWLERLAWEFDDPSDSRARGERDEHARGEAYTTAPAASTELADLRFQLLSAVDELLAPHAAGDSLTGGAWAERIYSALQTLGAPEVLAAWAEAAEVNGDFEARDQHRAAWAALLEVLQDLHDVLATEPATLATIADLVGDALQSRTFGLTPPTTDQVLVSAVDRSRHPELKFAYLVHLNDGVFPQPEPGAGLFSQDEAVRLAEAGIADFTPPHRHVENERLLFYIAATRAARQLTLSFSRCDADAGDLTPSRWLREIGVPAEDAPPTERSPQTLRELARAVLVRSPDGLAAEELHALQNAALGPERCGVRFRAMLAGLAYRNHPPRLGNFRRAEDEAPEVVWRASPSEIESYLQCPFQHFLRYGLRLGERAEPRPMHLDLGVALHELLAQTMADGINCPDWQAWLAAGWRDSLDSAVEKWVRRLPTSLRRRRPAWWHRASSIRELLSEKLGALVDALARGRFRPHRIEAAFGKRADRSIPLPIAPGQVVALRGVIDRIDLDEEADPPLLVIHDYKSAADSLGHPFLLGDRLQVFLYGLAAHAFVAGAEPSSSTLHATLAGVFLSPLYPNLDAAETNYFAEYPSDQRAYLYRPHGAFSDFAADELDGSLSHEQPSPVARMKLKKASKESQERSFNKTSSQDVLSAADFARRLDQAKQTLALAAKGVIDGDISIAPLVVRRVRACKHCDFGHVCRFEPRIDPSRPVEGYLPAFNGAAPSAEGDA